MASTRPHPLLHYLRRALGTPGGGSADADLLGRFVADRDEAAFELLVWRHAALVVQVCQQVLKDTQLVEDAFQATFLVLARTAGSIGRRESLGGWLYRVAHRIALRARAQDGKHRAVALDAGAIEAPAEAGSAERRELQQAVGAEVDRLPARYRAAIVACYFESRTVEEAAHQLGWPRGTVAGRLARARQLLKRRLLRRGIELPAGAFVAALPEPAAQAVLAKLIHPTLRAARFFAARTATGVPVPRSVSLAEGVLEAMFWTRMRVVMIVMLVAGLGGAGSVLLSGHAGEADRLAAKAPPRAAPAPDARGTAALVPEEDTHLRERAQSRLNLKRLAQAMLEYEKKYGHLPPPAIYDKNGKALLSWRVALLPFLDQNNLYKLFHLDEPWNSPHNRTLENILVKVYYQPWKADVPHGRTFYRVFVSPSPHGITAAFVKGPGLRLASITDGASRTLLIVEAGSAVPWTKPEDLHYAEDEPVPELGGLFPDVFHAVTADGAVHTFSKNADEKDLRAAITANGAEVIDLAQIEARFRPGKKNAAEVDALRQQLADVDRQLYDTRSRIQLLREQRAVLRELLRAQDSIPPARRLEHLRQERAGWQRELEEVKGEIEALGAEIRRLERAEEKK